MATINQLELSHFTGTENWYKWLGGLVITDGVHYLARNGAGWLVDAIASYQGKLRSVEDVKYFQLWELVVDGNKATLTCRADSDQEPVVSQDIEYTDFPLPSIKLYVELGSLDGDTEQLICMLPSER